MKKPKVYRREKMEGEHLSYFFWHSLISLVLFFMITVRLEIFNITDIELSYIITWGFVESVFWVFIISCAVEVIGRFIGYYLIIIPFSKYIYKRDCMGFRMISQGINRFSYKTIITLLITSFLFSVGAIWLIHDLIFEENTFWSIILIYIMFKFGVFIIVKIFIK